MSRSARLLTLVFAFLPVMWGTCVTWFAPATASGHASTVVCRCCERAAPEGEAPSPDPSERDDGCPGCGFSEAGRGVIPGAAVPPLPRVSSLPWTAGLVVAPPLLVSESPPALPTTSCGPPLARLDSVVLLI